MYCTRVTHACRIRCTSRLCPRSTPNATRDRTGTATPLLAPARTSTCDRSPLARQSMSRPQEAHDLPCKLTHKASTQDGLPCTGPAAQSPRQSLRRQSAHIEAATTSPPIPRPHRPCIGRPMSMNEVIPMEVIHTAQHPPPPRRTPAHKSTRRDAFLAEPLTAAARGGLCEALQERPHA